jgi:L-lactate dehydrogenase complex protein LldF
MDSRPAYEAAQRAGRLGLSLLQHGNGRPGRLPGLKGWTASRDLPGPEPSFRSWWRQREAGGDGPSVPEGPPPAAGEPTGEAS